MLNLFFVSNKKDLAAALTVDPTMFYAFKLLTHCEPSHWGGRFDEKQWKSPTEHQAQNLYKRVHKLYPEAVMGTDRTSSTLFPTVKVLAYENKTKDQCLALLANGYAKLRSDLDEDLNYVMDTGYEMMAEEDNEYAWAMQDRVDFRRKYVRWAQFMLFVNRIVTPLWMLDVKYGAQPDELGRYLAKYVFLPKPKCLSCGVEWDDKMRLTFDRCSLCKGHVCRFKHNGSIECCDAHEKTCKQT